MTTPTDTAKAREIALRLDGKNTIWVETATEIIASALQHERERVLALVYAKDAFSIERMSACLAVALVCDEELDKSGALLGRVRKQAAAIRQALTGEEK